MCSPTYCIGPWTFYEILFHVTMNAPYCASSASRNSIEVWLGGNSSKLSHLFYILVAAPQSATDLFRRICCLERLPKNGLLFSVEIEDERDCSALSRAPHGPTIWRKRPHGGTIAIESKDEGCTIEWPWGVNLVPISQLSRWKRLAFWTMFWDDIL